MPQILERDEGNKKRKQRLAKQKKGPGVFVYDGTAVDHEWIPTPLLTGKKVALLDAAGMPIVDGSGRQRYENASKIVVDSSGRPVMGGMPKKITKPIKVFKLRGVEFPAGKPVTVENDSLALKLRCMSCFSEVDGEEMEPDLSIVTRKGASKASLNAAIEAVGGRETYIAKHKKFKIGAGAETADANPSKAATKAPASEKTFADMTKAELLAAAETYEIDVPAGANKAELIDLLEQAEAEKA